MRLWTILLCCSIAFGQDPKPKVDPLGRSSPRSSITGFLRAVEAGRYTAAANYLDIPERNRNTIGVTLAKELQAVMNDGFDHPLGLITEKPEGIEEDTLAPNKENLGEIKIADESVDLILTRVNDPENGQIWLVSAETLSRVPVLYKKITGFAFLEMIPPQLQEKFLGVEWWQWIGFIILFLVAYGLAQLFGLVVRIVLRRTKKISMNALPQGAILLLAFFLHSRFVASLEIPILYLSYYRRFVAALVLIGLTWLLMRGIDRLAEIARMRAVSSGRLATGSWVIIGRRMTKVVLIAAVALIFLGWMGFNLSAAVAGVGIGGIAIGLGAQKTLENLFGGISIASDEVVRVGDTCNFAGRTGTVTDIGLRSTRVRTAERTELSIPNGVLATMTVENLSMRDKLLFQTTINLKYETTAEQFQTILQNIRDLLTLDSRVETATIRVRFINYGDNALQMEIFSYILTSDFNRFAEAREDLLLKIMGIVQGAGTNFSFPSPTTVYLEDKRA